MLGLAGGAGGGRWGGAARDRREQKGRGLPVRVPGAGLSREPRCGYGTCNRVGGLKVCLADVGSAGLARLRGGGGAGSTGHLLVRFGSVLVSFTGH